ncbi:MAG: queuosine salvage family protein [Candidatus Acetothermia bacterium]|nr:queuosine salvage family protein [Candidatus Acetothermia bacterium]
MENPVRTGSRWIVRRARWVRLDRNALDALAGWLVDLPLSTWEGRYHFRGAEELSLRYLLVLDALNFCFWPNKAWSVAGPAGERLTGYFALAYALRRAAEGDPEFFEPENMAALDVDGLRRILGDIALLPLRARVVREVGEALLRFGSARAFFAAARGSCRRLVELLTAHLPSFRDAAEYRGRAVFFHKRAQILCADLAGAFAGEGPGRLTDLDWLTAFADYKLPQILRAEGALALHPALAQRLDRMEPIPAGSPPEVELRAATVVAVEELTAALERRGRPLRAFEVDWLLWHLSQRQLPVPHHRTLTVFY